MKIVYSIADNRQLLKDLVEQAFTQIERITGAYEKQKSEMLEEDERIKALPWYKSWFQCSHSEFAYLKIHYALRNLREHRRICLSILSSIQNGLIVILDGDDLEMVEQYATKQSS